MSLSDKIYLAFTICAFLLSILSIIFVVLNLKQNSNMLEASTRAYLSVFIIRGHLSGTSTIVLKNFGKSSAIVNKVECDADFSGSATLDFIPFKNIAGLHLSPFENISYDIEGKPFFNKNCQNPITITIDYSCYKKKYSEQIVLDLKPYMHCSASRVDITSQNFKKHLVHSIQDVSEALLKK